MKNSVATKHKTTSRGLTPKQKVFCQEYLIDLNATQAAIRAGYSAKTADKTGSELLGKTRIAETIREAMEKRAAKVEITAERVLQEIARLAFSDIRKAVSFGPAGVEIRQDTELDDDTAACISEVSETVSEGGRTRKIKLYSKEKALEQLAKHVGLYDQKQDKDDAGTLAEKMRAYAVALTNATKGTPPA